LSCFVLDNQTIYHKLKAFLVDSPGWAWIELHDTAENGRAAYIAWTEHYNGEVKLSKRTGLWQSGNLRNSTTKMNAA
jgi:hypothetical protein